MTVKPRAERLRNHFVGWQCRVRADAMRRRAGRPTAAMRPRVSSGTGVEVAPAVTTLLMPAEPTPPAAAFRHLVRRTHDPRDRREAAVTLLAEHCYRRASAFSGLLTASFAADSPLALMLVREAGCRLAFAQDGQRYDLPCAVTPLGRDDPRWRATYWHNALFNPALPPDIQVLAFKPRWLDATAAPAPDGGRSG